MRYILTRDRGTIKGHTKGFDDRTHAESAAMRIVFDTGQPVTVTSIEGGRFQDLTTFSLLPIGSPIHA